MLLKKVCCVNEYMKDYKVCCGYSRGRDNREGREGG